MALRRPRPLSMAVAAVLLCLLAGCAASEAGPNEVLCDSFVRGKTGDCADPIPGEYAEVCPLMPGTPPPGEYGPYIDESRCRSIGIYSGPEVDQQKAVGGEATVVVEGSGAATDQQKPEDTGFPVSGQETTGPASGQETTRVEETAPPHVQETTAFTPSNKIAFSSNRDGNYEIYTANPDGSSPKRLTNNAYAHYQPAWSPDGTKIAMQESGHIAVMDADASNPTNLTTNRGDFFNFGPTWLPNGEQVAFGSSGPPSQLSDIYKMDADGSNQTNLTNTPEVDEVYPDFSPDGSRMCVYRGLMARGSGIYVTDADGSNPTRLSDERSGVGCQWSPDGRKIAFTYPVDRAGDVFVVNADGSGNPTNLTSNAAQDGLGGWSPDGSRISFTSDRDGDIEVYTMNADGSGVAQVTTNSNAKDIEPSLWLRPDTAPKKGVQAD